MEWMLRTQRKRAKFLNQVNNNKKKMESKNNR